MFVVIPASNHLSVLFHAIRCNYPLFALNGQNILFKYSQCGGKKAGQCWLTLLVSQLSAPHVRLAPIGGHEISMWSLCLGLLVG